MALSSEQRKARARAQFIKAFGFDPLPGGDTAPAVANALEALDRWWDSGSECKDAFDACIRNLRRAEQERCCGHIYGQCGSDNVAQRTVDAIRRQP